ncbi:MAG: 30S ribosomal protein S3 [Spirochaetaceae bacterium]|nr:30S ribosomal protein S3 [Spirochaetaceae bacterium]
MGQKVNPTGLRMGINQSWRSKWYVDPREYAATLHEDLSLRKTIDTAPETRGADIAQVEIIRHPQRIALIIHTGRPGVVIGAKGQNIERLGSKLQRQVGKKIQIKIKEIQRPETNAQLIAMNIARQLRGRASFRRVMKMAINNAMRAGVQGIKIRAGGRLNGAEMSRVQQYKEGRIPLHTFRADIEYGFSVAITTVGTLGIKVWVFHGEVFGRDKKDDAGLLLKRQRGREEAA